MFIISVFELYYCQLSRYHDILVDDNYLHITSLGGILQKLLSTQLEELACLVVVNGADQKIVANSPSVCTV